MTPLALTITANNMSRALGSPNPAFSATVNGFVNGDTAAVVSGSPSVICLADAQSPVGAYPLVPALGTLSAVNYTFENFVNGTLTVTNLTSGGSNSSIRLTSLKQLPNGQYQLRLQGQAGASFRLEASSDFVTWETLMNTNLQTSVFDWTDPELASTSKRFYRVVVP